jgi:hypothetical protein
LKKPSSDAIAHLALLISVIALAVALFEAYNNRQAARAAVKPIVETSFEFNKGGTGWQFDNSGVGPAVIKWFDVFVDGTQVPSWQLVGRALNLSKDSAGYRFIIPAGKTYPAGTTKQLFWVENLNEQETIRRNAARIRFRFCYCSIRDECWIKDTGTAAPAEANCERPRDLSVFN